MTRDTITDKTRTPQSSKSMNVSRHEQDRAIIARNTTSLSAPTVRKSSETRGGAERNNIVATDSPVQSKTIVTRNAATRARASQNTKNLMSSMSTRSEMTSFCKAQYTECMDNFCNVLDDNQGRCSCSKNIKNYEKTEAALKEATEALQDVAQQIQYIGLSKYEIETLFSQTEAELQMQNTNDNSQIKNSLDKIKGLIVDIKPGTASSTDVTAGVSMDLSGLLDFNIGSAGFDLSSLFGTTTTSTSSISNQRGEQLYKTAAARCKTAVLNDCQSQGVDIAVVSNAYDLEIDKQCVAYERSLTDANDEMRQTVRNAQSVLQRARLMVAQQKNSYDLRGCINALDSCMQDDYVCGSDYENCLDPSGKYIVNGEIVIGSTPGQAVPDTANSLQLDSGNVYSTDGLYATWNYTKEGKKYNAWGVDRGNNITEGGLNGYIKSTILSSYPNQAGTSMSQYLQYKIGYIEKSKKYGMCADVLSKCQDYTFCNGKYVPDNRVVKEYLMRTMVQIKASQDNLLSDYAETCISDVTSCLGENNYDTNQNIAMNACRSMIKTCMSVNGNAAADPTPAAMTTWVNGIMKRAGGSSGGNNSTGGSSGGGNSASGDQDGGTSTSQITVQYNSNGGTSVSGGSCTLGGTFTLPSAPTRSGYTFRGWYVNGTTYAASAKIGCSAGVLGASSGNVTIEAVWDVNSTNQTKITLVYNSNGGTSVGGTTCVLDDVVTLASAPTRSGYTFQGWSVNGATYAASANIGCSAGVLGTSSGTVTVTAVWTANPASQTKITLVYNSNGGTSVSGGTCTLGGAFTLPSAPTRSGYTFRGWSVNGTIYGASAGVGCSAGVLGASSGTVTITAQWVADTKDCDSQVCTIDLDLNGGEVGTGRLYYYQGDLYLDEQLTKKMTTTDYPLTYPTKQGYNFEGYYYTDATGQLVQIIYGTGYVDTTEDLGALSYHSTLTAKWSPDTCTVKFYGTDGTTLLKSVEYSASAWVENPQISGIDIWSVNGNMFVAQDNYYLGQTDAEIDTEICEIKYYAIAPIASGTTINIKYNTDGGATVGTSSCTAGGWFTLPPAPTKSGYAFTGWRLSGGTSLPGARLPCIATVLGVSSGTAQITAQWEKWVGDDKSCSNISFNNSYRIEDNVVVVELDRDEYGLFASTACPGDSDGFPDVRPTTCSDTNCTFDGWYTSYGTTVPNNYEYMDKVFDTNGKLLNSNLQAAYNVVVEAYPRCVCPDE